MQKNTISRVSLWAFGAAIALQFIMPFVYPIVAYDSTVHLNWLEQFPRLFHEGNLYPRWMPDSFWGFGSPAFYFYPPLAYWCASLISFILPNLSVAIYHTLGLLATIASGATCYWYLRSLVDSKHSAFVGALVYGVFPYRLLDLYLRNAIGEHIAFIFLPLILLGIELNLHSDEKKIYVRSIVISAIGWAGLLLSNIPTAVIALYAIPIYSWIRSREKKQYRKFFFPLIGASIGAMIAAVYLLPIPEYTSAIKLSHLWDLKDSEYNSGYSLLDIFHGKYRYFYIGLIVTQVIGAWLLFKFNAEKKNSKNRNIFTVFFLFLLIATALQIPYLLQPLWNLLPFFKLIQFSYRWDIIVVIASAVYVAFGYYKHEEKAIKCFVGISSIVTIIISLGYFYTMDGLHIKAKDIPGHIDAPEYIPVSANNNYEIARNTLKEHAMDDLIHSESEVLRVHIFAVTPTAIRFSTDSSQSAMPVVFHRMYFPAWHLHRRDGPDIQITSDSLGRINAILPSIGGEYSLSLEESQEEKAGKIISLAGLSLLAIFSLLTISWRKPKSS